MIFLYLPGDGSNGFLSLTMEFFSFLCYKQSSCMIFYREVLWYPSPGRQKWSFGVP